MPFLDISASQVGKGIGVGYDRNVVAGAHDVGDVDEELPA